MFPLSSAADVGAFFVWRLENDFRLSSLDAKLISSACLFRCTRCVNAHYGCSAYVVGCGSRDGTGRPRSWRLVAVHDARGRTRRSYLGESRSQARHRVVQGRRATPTSDDGRRHRFRSRVGSRDGLSAKGVPAIGVAVDDASPDRSGIVIARTAPIKTIADLKGKKSAFQPRDR